MKPLIAFSIIAIALASCTSKQQRQDEHDSTEMEHIADSMMNDTLGIDSLSKALPLQDSSLYKKPEGELHK